MLSSVYGTTRRRAELWEALARDAHHFEVKTAEAAKPLRAFVHGLLDYSPLWLRGLYAVRRVAARPLGVTLPGITERRDPATVSTQHAVAGDEALDPYFEPGATVGPFVVEDAQHGVFWLGRAEDATLTARMAVAQTSPPTAAPDAIRRFEVATAVRFKHAGGRLYFTAVKPFHHLVLDAMLRHAARSPAHSDS